MMGRFELWALQESSLVIFAPSERNKLWKECAVDCSKLRLFSKKVIAQIVDNDGFEELGILEPELFEQVINGVLMDKSVELSLKEKMPPSDCLYED